MIHHDALGLHLDGAIDDDLPLADVRVPVEVAHASGCEVHNGAAHVLTDWDIGLVSEQDTATGGVGLQTSTLVSKASAAVRQKNSRFTSDIVQLKTATHECTDTIFPVLLCSA